MAEQSLNEQDMHEPAAAPADDGAAGSAPDDEVRRERDSLQDRLLRTAAEFDNYRKRIERERRELSAFVAGDVMLEILPIVDNLERALQAAPGAEPDSLRKGVELIHKQMVDLLKKRGVQPIEALGADFDPNLHEAVLHEESESHREGEVMQEMQRGYTLGERLLRPSMGKVARRP